MTDTRAWMGETVGVEAQGADVRMASRVDVFLSYNSRDQVVIERIAQRLRTAGLEPCPRRR